MVSSVNNANPYAALSRMEQAAPSAAAGNEPKPQREAGPEGGRTSDVGPAVQVNISENALESSRAVKAARQAAAEEAVRRNSEAEQASAARNEPPLPEPPATPAEQRRESPLPE